MNISLKHKDYKILKPIKENSLEECVEAELALPEYMPEILRIIKTVTIPKIISCKIVGERITIEGACEMRMIYTAEDGCLYSFSQSRQFTRYCESPEFINAVDLNGELTTAFVNCKATGTKKAEIKTCIKIKINVYLEEKQDIIGVDEECNIEQKTETITAVSLGCKKTRAFSMSDTVNLSEPCAFLLASKANAVLTEIKKISNKIMIRGEALVDLSYVNSENKALTEAFVHSIPINQIIELEGFEERFEGSVELRVTSIDLIPKGEQSGFITAFDISLGIDACVTMFEKTELTLLKDAYSVNCGIDLKKESLLLRNLLCDINENYIVNDSFTVNGEGVSSVLSCSGELGSVNVSQENGELNIKGTLSLSFIVRDNGNSVSCINKVFDFCYKKQGDFYDKKLICEPYLQLLNVKCALRNSNNIEISAEICVLAAVYDELYTAVVTEITDNDVPVNKEHHALTVYFPQGNNEGLWNIAKRYNATVSAIAAENDLQGETTENLKILFIPCA